MVKIEEIEGHIYRVWNPAGTFKYIITGGALTGSDKTLNLPVITGTDTYAVLGLAQTYTAAQTIGAKLDINKQFHRTGITSPSQITADQTDNYAPTGWDTSSVLRLDADQNYNHITGLGDTTQTSGMQVRLINIGSKIILLCQEHSSSTAGNRFDFNGIDVALFPKQTIDLVYDGTLSRWTTATYSNIRSQRPDVTKWGVWDASTASSGTGMGSGALASIAVGTGSTGNSGSPSSAGLYRIYDTGATINSISGLRTGAVQTARILNPYFKCRLLTGASIANTRIYAGFVNTGNAPTSQADPLNALAGCALWYDSAVNANWRRLHNDSSGASVSDDTSVAVATTTEYVVEIMALTDSKFRFVFNNTTTDITTDIPASTTTLAWWIYIENTLGASRTLTNFYVYWTSDK